MKKIILVLGITASLAACKKETTTTEPVINSTDMGLEASFKFSGNLAAEKGAATATPFGTLSFIADRKGMPGNALHFDGSSKLALANIFQKGTASSISVWIAAEVFNGPLKYFITPNSNGLAFGQTGTTISGVVSVPFTKGASVATAENNWHHYALTYDGNDVRLYKDGVLADSKTNPGTCGDGATSFMLGCLNNSFWKGNIDDLKFYSKTLSAAEVTKLASE
jgi:hypothetical protein